MPRETVVVPHQVVVRLDGGLVAFDQLVGDLLHLLDRHAAVDVEGFHGGVEAVHMVTEPVGTEVVAPDGLEDELPDPYPDVERRQPQLRLRDEVAVEIGCTLGHYPSSPPPWPDPPRRCQP